jgi:hypothetical protein
MRIVAKKALTEFTLLKYSSCKLNALPVNPSRFNDSPNNFPAFSAYGWQLPRYRLWGTSLNSFLYWNCECMGLKWHGTSDTAPSPSLHDSDFTCHHPLCVYRFHHTVFMNIWSRSTIFIFNIFQYDKYLHKPVWRFALSDKAPIGQAVGWTTPHNRSGCGGQDKDPCTRLESKRMSNFSS